jgi:colanic acid biosynthesis glycosyl transferase WcaI
MPIAHARLSEAVSSVPGRRLRLTFFNRSYYPDYGATGQLLTELAEDLVARHGHAVTVVAGVPLNSGASGLRPPRWYRPVQEEQHNGVRILRAFGTTADKRRFAGRVANYLSYVTTSMLAALWLGRTDVVIALTDPPIIGLVAIAAARVRGARFVYLSQDIFPEVARLLEDFQSTRLENLLQRVGRFTAARADRIIALGDTMKRRLVTTKGADPNRIRVIHNWADCEAIRPAAKDNPFSRAQGLADRFVVMHSGNVGLSQGIDRLLDAADRLRDLSELVIAIVGEGAQKQALMDDAARRNLANVRFFPYQPKAGLIDSFATADVFIVSLKRGLSGFIVPSKLYGILAAGRPFIAAVEDDCEAAEIARQFDCGVVVEPGSVDQMADAIRGLYMDRTRAAAMAARAREAGLTFDRRRAVAAYDSVFLELADGHGR